MSAETHKMEPLEEMMVAGIAAQTETMRCLLAEMQALQALIPVKPARAETEAEQEAEFDNLPV